MHIRIQALVLVALSLEGTFAQPAHRHQHKHRRDLADVLREKTDLGKRTDPDWVKDVDWVKVCANGACDPNTPKKLAVNPVNAGSAAPQTSSTVPAPASSSAAPAPSSPSTSSSSSEGSSSGGTGSCSDLSSVWKSGDTSRSMGTTSADITAPWTTFGQSTPAKNVGSTDSYVGNVGSPYGSNMLPLTNCDVSSHKYSITFNNADTSKIEVALWNKVGDDGQALSGASRNAFWKFPLEAGQSAAFAIADNSQVAFSQACDRNTYPGSFDCTWGEADFGDQNSPNNGGSGYDRSSIQNSKGNTGLLSVCVDGHDCSSEAGNSFVSDKQSNAGGNLYVPPGQPMHVKVTLG